MMLFSSYFVDFIANWRKIKRKVLIVGHKYAFSCELIWSIHKYYLILPRFKAVEFQLIIKVDY